MSADNSSLDSDVQQILSELRVNLRVLVCGPGVTSKAAWFDKRAEVVKALNDSSQGKDTVFTSEELFARLPPTPIEYGYAELAHAEESDIIIALVMASPSRQGGVYRELEIIAQHPRLRNKVWIFLPDNKTYLRRFQAGMLDAYRAHQKICLSWNTLRTCERLREMCVSKVEEERKVRMLDRMLARTHMSGQ